MGITAKPTGKMRSIIKRIDNENEKERKSLRKNKVKHTQEGK